MSIAISIENLRVSYGEHEALRGVTFSLESGAVGLLGPNGAGKSTLVKTMLGFIRATQGKATLFGLEMPRHALEVRQKLGYMPEREVMSPKVSAVSFLTYCGCLFGMTRVDAMERAHEVLNYVGVGENRYRKMETYSTGMCQRVKFAQALIHDPKVLLLDEPTSGLDPEGRIEMLELIAELAHKRKVTVLLSTHLLPDVEHVCDRVIMINKGLVVLDADIGVVTAPRDNVYEVRVRDNDETFLNALAAAGVMARPQLNGNIRLSMSDGTEVRRIFEIAETSKTQIRHFQPVRQSLEEAFMEAINQEP